MYDETYTADPTTAADSFGADVETYGTYDDWSTDPGLGCCEPPPEPEFTSCWDTSDVADTSSWEPPAPPAWDPAPASSSVMPMGQPGAAVPAPELDPSAVIPAGQPGGPVPSYEAGVHFPPVVLPSNSASYHDAIGPVVDPFTSPVPTGPSNFASYHDAVERIDPFTNPGQVGVPVAQFTTSPRFISSDGDWAMRALYERALATPNPLDDVQILNLMHHNATLQQGPYGLRAF